MDLQEFLEKVKEDMKEIDAKIKAFKTQRQILLAWFKDGDREKDEIQKGNFVKVYFGDNDFGFCFEAALEFIWLQTYMNNHHLLKEGDSIANIIKWFNEKDVLEKMITRAAYLFTEFGQIEGATRGGHDRYKIFMEIPELNKKTEGYLSEIKISFHNSNKFSKKWQNGECCCWNLDTGKAESY